jgi:hypothetical protein
MLTLLTGAFAPRIRLLSAERLRPVKGQGFPDLGSLIQIGFVVGTVFQASIGAVVNTGSIWLFRHFFVGVAFDTQEDVDYPTVLQTVANANIGFTPRSTKLR